MVLWIAQYVPVLPIPALLQKINFQSHFDHFFCHSNLCDNKRQTCSEQQLVQGWVAHHITFSKFHEQQQCPLELHGQAILDTECEEQIMVAPQTAATWDDFNFVTTNHKD